MFQENQYTSLYHVLSDNRAMLRIVVKSPPE